MTNKIFLVNFCLFWMALGAPSGQTADLRLRNMGERGNPAETNIVYAVQDSDPRAADRNPQLTLLPSAVGKFAYFVDNMGSKSLPCNTTEDAGKKLQAIIDAVPDESTLIWPMNCPTVLGTGVNTGGSAISINNRIGLRFVSMGREQNFGGMTAPRFLWAGAGGATFNRGFNVTFEGLLSGSKAAAKQSTPFLSSIRRAPDQT